MPLSTPPFLSLSLTILDITSTSYYSGCHSSLKLETINATYFFLLIYYSVCIYISICLLLQIRCVFLNWKKLTESESESESESERVGVWNKAELIMVTKEKDEELAIFFEMRRREIDNERNISVQPNTALGQYIFIFTFFCISDFFFKILIY